MDIFQTVSNIGIIPVIAIEDAAKAVPLAKALTARSEERRVGKECL